VGRGTDPPVPTDDNAAQRVSEAVQRLLDAQKDTPQRLRKTQRGLADALKIDAATINQAIARRKGQAFRLVQLDAIADYFGVTPATLIQRPTSELWELTPNEVRLVRHWRAWAFDVQTAVMQLLDFFAGMLPEEKEDRRLFQKWRKLSRQDRAYAESTIDDLLRREAQDRVAAREQAGSAVHRHRTAGNTRSARARNRPSGSK
jgi:hypothetical protein